MATTEKPPIDTFSVKRLYISPFDPTLFKSTVSPKLTQQPKVVSFHSIPNFPEKNYGYLEVPQYEAIQLQRKLNGLILRGMKVRVEDAREDRKRKARELEGTDSHEKNERNSNSPLKRPKNSAKKHRNGVLPGIELPQGRHVKRGWESSVSLGGKNRSGKAKILEGNDAEMVFRTKIPANKASEIQISQPNRKRTQTRVRGAGSGVNTEVKEFTKQTKFMSFLRDEASSNPAVSTTTFEDGRGWVNESGEIIEEAASIRSRARNLKAQEETEGKRSPSSVSSSDSEESSIVSSDSDSDLASGLDSDSDSDSASESDSDSGSKSSSDSKESIVCRSSIQARTQTQSDNLVTSEASAAVKSLDTTDESLYKNVHPLEALFKRPAPIQSDAEKPKAAKNTPRPAPIKTEFTFFGNDGIENNDGGTEDEEDEDVTMAPPQTPFTSRDLEGRAVRSAAPTPDTAAIGGRFAAVWRRSKAHNGHNSNGEENDDEEEEGDDDEDEETTPIPSSRAGQSLQKQQNDFEKTFWEQRGEFNRSWKERKHEARKEMRRKQNRRSARIGSQRRTE